MRIIKTGIAFAAACAVSLTLAGCSSAPKAPSSDVYSAETARFLAENISSQLGEDAKLWQVQLGGQSMTASYSNPDKKYVATVDEKQRVELSDEDANADKSVKLNKSLPDYAGELATFATGAKKHCDQPDLRVFSYAAFNQEVYLGTCGLSDDLLKIGELELSKETDFNDPDQFATIISQFAGLTEKPLSGVRIGTLEEGKQGVQVEFANEFSVSYSTGEASAFTLKNVDSEKKRPEFAASDINAEGLAKVYREEAEAAGAPVQLLIYKDAGQDKVLITSKRPDGTTRVFDAAGEHLVDA